MKIESFEDSIAWQKAQSFSLLIYRTFYRCKDYSFKNQIERATVSIMNNIAEGFERQTDKEMKQFLYIAKGSAGEVRSMLSLAKELHYVSANEYTTLVSDAKEISRLLAGFIRKL